jgi:uncharacterized iron-regulated membrane protein
MERDMSVIEQSDARVRLGLGANIRRLLLRIHLWIGIVFCIPFAVLGVTGAYLVYDQDVTAPPRATAVGEYKAPTAIIAAALAANPDLRATNLSMPLVAGDPATVRVVRAGVRGTSQIFVDPVSLDVLGTREGVRTPLSDLMHGLHGSFSLGGRTGRPIVGWMGVGMTFLGISGLIMWWPRRGAWKNSLGVRKNARGFVWHRQLHATVGVLGWVAFVVVSFTGVAISFPQTTTAAFHGLFGGDPTPARIANIEALPNTVAIDADQAAALAVRAASAARLGSLNLPAEADQPYRLTLIADNALAGAPLITAVVDPYRAEVIALRDPRTFKLGDSIMAWQRTLHDGRAIGPVWAFLVFFSGLMPPLFAVTGTAMWWPRRRARMQVRAQQSPVAVGVPAE